MAEQPTANTTSKELSQLSPFRDAPLPACLRRQRSMTNREVGSLNDDAHEGFRARVWSAMPLLLPCNVPDTALNVQILGVERTCFPGRVKWRYLTLPRDITLPSENIDNGKEPVLRLGDIHVHFRLPGYKSFIQWSNKWVRVEGVPKGIRESFWTAYGA